MKELWPDRRRNCSTCYLIAVGAAVPPWQLTRLLENQLREDVEVTPASAQICAVFPAEDAVRLLTRRSCSCDLVEATPRLGRTSRLQVALTSMLRAPLVRGVSELTALRLYVSSGAEPKRFSAPPRYLPLAELAAVTGNFPLDSLVELSGRTNASEKTAFIRDDALS